MFTISDLEKTKSALRALQVCSELIKAGLQPGENAQAVVASLNFLSFLITETETRVKQLEAQDDG